MVAPHYVCNFFYWGLITDLLIFMLCFLNLCVCTQQTKNLKVYVKLIQDY